MASLRNIFSQQVNSKENNLVLNLDTGTIENFVYTETDDGSFK